MGFSMNFLLNLIFITVIIPLFLLLIFLYIYNQQTKKYHPIGGTVFNMLINFKRLHHYMADLAAKYKTFRMISPFRGEIYTTDPVLVEYILKTNFQNYGKGTHVHNLLEDFLGDGIFTVDGDEWQEQRKLSSHEFSTKVLRDFSCVTFRKNAVKLGNIFLEAAKSNQVVDINDLFMKATADSIFKVAFGVDLDNLSGSNEEGVRFSRAFDDANELTYNRLVDITWKIKKYFNIGSEAELKKNLKVVDEFVYKVIRTKSEQMSKPKDNYLVSYVYSVSQTIIEVYSFTCSSLFTPFNLTFDLRTLQLTKEDILSRFMQMENRDPKYFRDIIMNYVLAGKDPIAATMTWLIYMLCKYPQVQDKVANDIKEAMYIKEEVTNVANFEARLSEDALEKMQYLQATLAETIRLYPALPLDLKICFSSDVLPDGCIVKKGDVVAYMPYAMGRMKFIWGDDAHEFKPERWLDANGCFHSKSPFKFTAFQAGPRTCLGREFAYRQMKIFSSILLGCFAFKLSNANEDPKYRTTINIQLDGPLNIYVSLRSGLHDP
ncbi:putative abieta-7,13-dien-18-ol hydroxylase [Helianthus annuus]|uniref:Abieta-7,13-dien-18-ol hydroxylase n=1 Tax=Helianthus annuus TaxID=4232 RepID=A0A251TYA3_HELAN|nr:putative abieta-7,13-dien-18-ol hydroxylase [Helianthus annuus]KAJ0623862.1 putative abieta-7,13-dien-18-ol hydroxylase [Helianthus annuus]KAJ0949032.1 putative abieta-7,13-dien-18-ol hydroxylase [Helianthus annuus]